MRDDVLRWIFWAGVIAGAVTAAAAMGDEAHLMCLLYAGLALTGCSLLMLLRQVLARKAAPPGPRMAVVQVTDISSAPSVALQAAENADRIGELAGETARVRAQAKQTDRRVNWLFEQMRDASDAAGVHLPDHDDTSPLPLQCIKGGRKDGSQAGLCAVGLPLVPLVLGGA